MLIAEALVHVLPFFRDVLDTPDTQHLGVKLLLLIVCAAAFAGINYLTMKRCVRTFEKLDL